MKQLIVILIFCVLLNSCIKCKDSQGELTSDEKSWLSYSGGEELKFKSDINLKDTFHVGNPTHNGSNGQSDYPCQHHQDAIYYKISNSQNNLDFRIDVSHNDQWNSGVAGISASILDSNFSRFNSSFIFSNFSPQNNIVINGQTFNNVYIMTRDSANFYGVWKIYYTKANGILRYDISHGDYWEKIN